MKHKRFCSLCLAVAFLASLLTVPTSAAQFSDVTGRFAWAAPYAEDLAEKGIAKGYEDGLYHPDEQLTAVQALVFCARILQLSNSIKTGMIQDYGSQITALLPSAQAWAAGELAVCLGGGILNMSELRTLCTTGAVSKPIAKEDLAVYLLRAMQLEGQAMALTSYSMDYTDNASISASRKPYVYLLGQFGVVEGNDKNQFEPKSYVNRAVMAAMISRAMTVMTDQSALVDLPAYQDYSFAAGVVESVTTNANNTITMVVASEASGSKAVTMVASTPIYLNNVGAPLSSVAAGQHAKFPLNSAGQPTAVYLNDTVSSHTGKVSAASQQSITILSGGASRTFSLDRCTEVKTPSGAGGPSLISSTEGYEQAVILATSTGLAVSVVLTGGSTLQEGLVGGVSYTSSGSVLTLTGFNGTTTDLPLSPETTVTVDGKASTLSASNSGKFASVTISNDTGMVTAVEIDTTARFIQGYVQKITNNVSLKSISLVSFENNSVLHYNLADTCTVTYEDSEIDFGRISLRNLATIQLDSNGRAIGIHTYPGTVVTQGTIANVEFGVTTILRVKQTDGSTVSFSLDMNNLPTFTRNGAASTVDKLLVGDSVSVTVRYNAVSSVDSTGQSANVKGTITSIATELAGTTISLSLDTGTTVSYPTSNNLAVTYNGKTQSLSFLKPGDVVAMVVSGNQIVSIDVTTPANNSSELSGTVLNVDGVAGTILFMLEDKTLVTVRASASTSIISAAGGSILFGSIKTGDHLSVYGSYSGAEFAATVIIRK